MFKDKYLVDYLYKKYKKTELEPDEASKGLLKKIRASMDIKDMASMINIDYEAGEKF